MRISDWSSDVCSSDLAINADYAARVAQLTDLIQNAGTVSDGSNTVALDNLLTSGTVTYDVTTGNLLQAEGADLATDILAGLPGSITAGNAAALATEVEDVYRAALDEATSRLKRSEEHTSELQSLMRISYAVFCLKKKITQRE